MVVRAHKGLEESSPVTRLEMINAGGLIKGAQIKAMGTKHVPFTAQWESGSMVTLSERSTVKDLFGAGAQRASLAALSAASCFRGPVTQAGSCVGKLVATAVAAINLHAPAAAPTM